MIEINISGQEMVEEMTIRRNYDLSTEKDQLGKETKDRAMIDRPLVMSQDLIIIGMISVSKKRPQQVYREVSKLRDEADRDESSASKKLKRVSGQKVQPERRGTDKLKNRANSKKLQLKWSELLLQLVHQS